jgi:hypothetical protein
LALAPKPGYTAEEKCFTDDGHDWAVPFVHWLAKTIPKSDDVALKATNVSGGCMQLTLLPRRFVRASQHPRWTVLAEPLPPAVRREARRQRGLPPAQRTVTVFAPGLALLRHR